MQLHIVKSLVLKVEVKAGPEQECLERDESHMWTSCNKLVTIQLTQNSFGATWKELKYIQQSARQNYTNIDASDDR